MAKLAVFRGTRLAVGASLAAAGAAVLAARGGLRVLAADLRPGGRLRERLIAGGDLPLDGDGGFFAPAAGGAPAVFCAPADPAAAAAGLAAAGADADAGFIVADAARSDAAVAVVVFTYAEDDLGRAREIAAAAGDARVLFVPSWVDAAFPGNADLRKRAAAALNADADELAALELPYAPQAAAADCATVLAAADFAAALTRLTARITAALDLAAALPEPTAALPPAQKQESAPPQTARTIAAESANIAAPTPVPTQPNAEPENADAVTGEQSPIAESDAETNAPPPPELATVAETDEAGESDEIQSTESTEAVADANANAETVADNKTVADGETDESDAIAVAPDSETEPTPTAETAAPPQPDREKTELAPTDNADQDDEIQSTASAEVVAEVVADDDAADDETVTDGETAAAPDDPDAPASPASESESPTDDEAEKTTAAESAEDAKAAEPTEAADKADNSGGLRIRITRTEDAESPREALSALAASALGEDPHLAAGKFTAKLPDPTRASASECFIALNRAVAALPPKAHAEYAPAYADYCATLAAQAQIRAPRLEETIRRRLSEFADQAGARRASIVNWLRLAEIALDQKDAADAETEIAAAVGEIEKLADDSNAEDGVRFCKVAALRLALKIPAMAANAAIRAQLAEAEAALPPALRHRLRAADAEQTVKQAADDLAEML